MTTTDYPWDPPMAGTEEAHLTGALDRLRTTFRFKADDLDAAGLRVRIGASALTLGGLLKHLAVCEDNMFTVRLSGAPIGAPWEGTDWNGDNDWEVDSAADNPGAALRPMGRRRRTVACEAQRGPGERRT